MLREHDIVTVIANVPEHSVSVGDVGAIVHCYSERDHYEVEILDAHGRSRGVVTLEGEQLLKLNLTSLVA